MQIIEVVGRASGTSRYFDLSELELDQNLLQWLRAHGVTIASSCDGEGVCKKCVIQEEWLTCKLTLRNFLERRPDGKIFVSYL